tara:strand:- start:132 stop:515 length:384 start_codon:yes stop_codon:yes gene_type:complete
MAKWNLEKLSNANQKGKPMTKYTRSEILDTAKEYVTKDRASDHGDMEDNFTTISEYWSLHLDYYVSPSDVAVMMTLLKLARIKSNPNSGSGDNWIDGCGYLSLGAELSAEKPEPEPEPVVAFQGGNV